MAASHTTKKRIKKLARKLAEQEIAEELMATYLNWWTKQEIHNLVSTGTLVMLPQGQGQSYIIGKNSLEKLDNYWLVTSTQSDVKLLFKEKMSAVFYCLYEHKRMYHASREIWQQDDILRKLDNDQSLYRHKYKIACEKQNSFAQDLWQARLSDVTPRFQDARERLQKMINRAKYIKIWD